MAYVLTGEITSKQKFALYMRCKVNTKDLVLSKEEASLCIQASEYDPDGVRAKLLECGAVPLETAKADKEEDSRELFAKAHAAGMEAADRELEGGPEATVFVRVDPGTHTFARYLKAHHEALKGQNLQGGMRMLVRGFGPDTFKAYEYAAAFSKVVRSVGITCNGSMNLL